MTDTVTILGRIAAEPSVGTTTSGIPVMNVRVASPQRRFDSRTQSWLETGTNWYGVAAFRRLAEHAGTSLRVGDAVIVTGRLKVREWEANGKRGTSVEIDADAIGHDLRWGTAAFAKAPRAGAVGGTVRSNGEAPDERDAPNAADSGEDREADAWGLSLDEDAAGSAQSTAEHEHDEMIGAE